MARTAAANADPLADQLRRLGADRLVQQGKQPRHLDVRAGPVLAAEGVEGEDGDLSPDRVLHQPANLVDPGGMSIELRDAVGARPATVAIHDDGDVNGPGTGLRRIVRTGGTRLSVGGRWRIRGSGRQGATHLRPPGPRAPWSRPPCPPRRSRDP